MNVGKNGTISDGNGQATETENFLCIGTRQAMKNGKFTDTEFFGKYVSVFVVDKPWPYVQYVI